MIDVCLIEETQNFSGNVLSPGLFVVHDSGRGGQDDVTELTGWEQVDDPLFEVTDADVVSWGDDTALVETVD